MVPRFLTYVMLLLAAVVGFCNAQGLQGINDLQSFDRPQGELIERADGSGVYTVCEIDRAGQWQVAFGDPQLWLELMKANPQLRDPNLIKPGDTLNVPKSLVRLFRYATGADNLSELTPETVRVVDTTPKATDEEKDPPYWIILGALIALAAILSKMFYERGKTDEYNRHAKEEASRKLADPYSGPDQVPGGLRTTEAAVAHFANAYHEHRNNMTVADSNKLPARVSIVNMKPVEVRGKMEIRYADSPNPVIKNIPDWIPAWKASLSDGTWSIALQECGNDVWYEGKRMTLPEDQIRDRQDAKEVTVNHEIWPAVSEDEIEAVETENNSEKTSAIPVYRELVIKSATRYVLHKHNSDQPDRIDVTQLQGMVSLSYINGEIIAETSDNKKVIGIIGDEPLDDKEVSESMENAMPNRSGETGPTDRRDFNDNSDNDNPAE